MNFRSALPAAIAVVMLTACSTTETTGSASLSISTSSATIAASGTTAEPTTSTTTTTSTTKKTTPSSSTTSTTTTTTSTPPPTSTSTKAVMAPEVITGSGDDIVTLTSTGIRIFTFDCPTCTRNVQVESDGSDALLVNEIGPYTGRILVDYRDDSATTELEIKANSDWTVTITDAFTTATMADSTGASGGSGDDVILFTGDGTKAAITHSGEGNFQVTSISADGLDLAVNEIGDYSGTVRLTTPALVQVSAEPGTPWLIKTS